MGGGSWMVYIVKWLKKNRENMYTTSIDKKKKKE